MTLHQPVGSHILIDKKDGTHTITIPHKKPGASRYFLLAFLLFWLGGWLMGEVSVLTMIASGKAGKAMPFMLFWLGGWTLGGILAGYTIYRLIRPAIPEQIIFHKNSASYSSGVVQLNGLDFLSFGQNPWKRLFEKNIKTKWTSVEFSSLRLRDTVSGNRLTIDIGNNRLDLARSASEIEREWLYDYLNHIVRY